MRRKCPIFFSDKVESVVVFTLGFWKVFLVISPPDFHIWWTAMLEMPQNVIKISKKFSQRWYLLQDCYGFLITQSILCLCTCLCFVYKGMHICTYSLYLCLSFYCTLSSVCEFISWPTTTASHLIPPPPLVAPLEFWANAAGHAGVAQQHDQNAHDATVFQHMLICVWGGTGPRFSHIVGLLSHS